MINTTTQQKTGGILCVKVGSNFIENLQLLCARCNLSKHDSLMEDWLTDAEDYWRWATRRFVFLTALLNKRI